MVLIRAQRILLILPKNGIFAIGYNFTDFAKEWNFCHRISSPNYPHSNELAENAVKAPITVIEKCRLDHKFKG